MNNNKSIFQVVDKNTSDRKFGRLYCCNGFIIFLLIILIVIVVILGLKYYFGINVY
jgi:hypothetical protein